MGRLRSAIDGLRAAARQAIDLRNLPLAVAAIEDLRAFGADATQEVEEVASAFCQGSARLLPEEAPMPHPELGDFQPLSAFLTGPALASKAAQIVQEFKRSQDRSAGTERPLLSPLPLFSGLQKDALRDLLSAFQMATVPAGKRVIEEGQVGDAAYVVARGELEISRRAVGAEGQPRVVVTRLGNGAFFGEMALLSNFPAPATVTATRPSILLVGKRDALGAVVAKHPEVGVQLAGHCRRHLVANLGWTSSVVAAVPPQERAALVERLETRMYEKGQRLVNYAEEAAGLHLIVSGDVAVVARDAGERVVLATLGAGETVGDVELVLCRKATADAIALHPTATLFLPRDEFFALVQEHPAILHGLYGIAVRRHNERVLALQAGSAFISDLELHAEVRTPAAAGAPVLEDGPASQQPVAASAQLPRRAPASAPVVRSSPPLVAPIAIAPTIILRDSRTPPPPASAAAPQIAAGAPAMPSAPLIQPPVDTPPRTRRTPSAETGARPSSSIPSPSFPPTTSTSLPPSKLVATRPLSPSRQSLRAAGVAAVAAGAVAAALLASRDNRTGSIASAAAAAGREVATSEGPGGEEKSAWDSRGFPVTAAWDSRGFPAGAVPATAATANAMAAKVEAVNSLPATAKAPRPMPGKPQARRVEKDARVPFAGASPAPVTAQAVNAPPPSPAPTSSLPAPVPPPPVGPAAPPAVTVAPPAATAAPAVTAAPVAKVAGANSAPLGPDDEFGGRR
jgi:cAMP-dependent protein kinase regulator